MEKRVFISDRWILCAWDSTQNVNIDFLWHILSTKNFQVPCFYKGKIAINKLNEIWDWMKVLFFTPYRKNFDMLDKNAFAKGVWLIKSFDENEWTYHTYLYWYDKADVEFINDILEWLWLKQKVIIKWKFIVLENYIQDYDIWDVVKTWIKNDDINSIFSFVFGISLVYGKIDISSENVLKSIVSHVPLVENLFDKKDMFDDIFNYLFDKWVFIKSNILSRKIWSTYQFTIKDEELLTVFIRYFDLFDVKVDDQSKEIFTKYLDYFKENWYLIDLTNEMKEYIIKTVLI